MQHAAERIGVSEIRANGYSKIFGVPFIVVSNMVQELFETPLASQKNQTSLRLSVSLSSVSENGRIY